MKKKLLAILLIATISLSMFAACGSNTSDTQKNGKVSIGAEEEVKSLYEITGEVGDGVELKAEDGKTKNSSFKDTYENNDKIEVHYYNFTLEDKDGNAVQPNGSVTVSIAKENLPEAKNYVVYYVEDKYFEKMNSYVDDNKLSFETTHFSTYAVLGYSDDVDTAMFISKQKTVDEEEREESLNCTADGYNVPQATGMFNSMMMEKYGDNLITTMCAMGSENLISYIVRDSFDKDPSMFEWEKDLELYKTCDFYKNNKIYHKYPWVIKVIYVDKNSNIVKTVILKDK